MSQFDRLGSPLLIACLLGAAAPAAHADEEPAGGENGGADLESGGLGIDPSRPRGDALLRPTQDDEATEGFTFSFHGFLRIPLRVGIGSGRSFVDGVDKGRKLHTPPQIPDGAYTDWRYTNVQGGPWTELWLRYGNDRVSANVEIAAYDVGDASYRDLVSQLGINQSFITIKAPNLFGDDGGVVWNVGAFSNRYGTAARYDAGKYDTYLFGATHVAGETLTAYYHVAPGVTIAADHGVGGKLQVPPFTTEEQQAPYLPYPGPVQQGSTYLHHAHLGVNLWTNLTIAGHFLTEWTDDARQPGEIDGRVTNVGVDAKLLESRFGDAYLGWSHLISKNPLRVGGAFEAIHSFEGWSLRDTYFGEAATGTGTIDTIMFQYTFSLARYFWSPQEFYGQAPDLQISAFGMYNKVKSNDPMFSAPSSRLKVGGDVLYETPLPWLAVGLRYDLVQPDMGDETYSFHEISPSVILRSQFASNEQVVIGYSYYRNGVNVRPSYPHEALLPDDHLLRIAAIMWW